MAREDFTDDEEYVEVLRAKFHNHYGIWIEYSDEDENYYAMIPDIPDCVGGGDSPEEALGELGEAEEILLDRYITNSEDIPRVTKTDLVRKLYIKHDPDVIANTSKFAANYLYPAIFQKEGAAYNVRFPDFDGCYTCGDDLKDAFCMAEDALALTIVERVKSGKSLPEPSKIEDIIPDSDEEVYYIYTNLHAYLEKTYDEEAD